MSTSLPGRSSIRSTFAGEPAPIQGLALLSLFLFHRVRRRPIISAEGKLNKETDQMAKVSPIRILGRWRAGFALDLHTHSSEFIGHNEYGHPMFSTVRSPVGELLYQLKNNDDLTAVDELVDAAETFVRRWDPDVEVIVPVPPSNANRGAQPVFLVGELLSSRLGLEWASNSVVKIKSTRQLKNVFDLDKRKELLDGTFAVKPDDLEGKRVLLFDDLYRSGATMNAVADVLQDESYVGAIYALTLTCTRSNR